MLYKRLKIPGYDLMLLYQQHRHDYINKIYYATAGLICTFVTIGIELNEAPRLMEIKPAKSDHALTFKGTPPSTILIFKEPGTLQRRNSFYVQQQQIKKHKSDLEHILDDSEND